VPTITQADIDAVRSGREESISRREVRGLFTYKEQGVYKVGLLVLSVDRGYTSFLGMMDGTSVGATGNTSALTVYRVQQRLKYLGFPGSLGETIQVNGDAKAQHASAAFQPREEFNTPKVWDTTEAAIRLFEAATNPSAAPGNDTVPGQPID